MKIQSSRLLASLNKFKDKVFRHDIFTQAAALALYTVFALPPLLILMLTFLSSLELSLQQPLINEVQGLMGKEAAKVFESIIASSTKNSNSSVTVWGFVILGVSASVIFAQLQSSLNTIFESENITEEKTTFKHDFKQFISRRIICFGMVLTFIFISIVSLLISGFLTFFVNGELQTWLKILQTLGSLGIYAILFSIILHWMPDRLVSWQAALKGGTITALLFMVGKVLIGMYLAYDPIGSTYGAMGSLGILLVWVYYSSLIVLFGAEISATISDPHLAKKRSQQTVKTV